MGLPIDRERFTDDDHARFTARLRQNLAALEALLRRPGFGEGPITLGAELEVSIVDAQALPCPINREVLARSLDPHLQLELDRFNIEYNLRPVPLAGRPFAELTTELGDALRGLDAAAVAQGGRVVPIGILPTLRPEDLQPSAMTDLPRFRALSAGLRRIRRRPFDIRIDGADPLTVACDDITFEGANTSFQVHLRVDPVAFADTYNAVQIATALAVAAGGNSPIFLGHRLWDETRVALFRQSIDSRGWEQLAWNAPARVSFGHGWVREGAIELFAEAVTLFPPLLPVVGTEDPHAPDAGDLPRLEELRLHQSTVWRWNRAIYDPGAGGHLRIEMRALPSGPTARDMAANAAFLVGLALGLRADVRRLLPSFPFEHAQYNFYQAAQDGLDAVLLWPSEVAPSPRETPVRELVLRLLPTAGQGLASAGVDGDDIRETMEVIRRRVESDTTGARWQRRRLAELERVCPRPRALAAMLEDYLAHVGRGLPVSDWGCDG